MLLDNFEQIGKLPLEVFAIGMRVVLILLTAFLAERFLRGLIRKFVESRLKDKIFKKEKRAQLETIISIFSGTSRFIIWSIAILVVLPEFGIDISPILAGLGVAGLAVGMAAKSVISDFIAGVFIVLEGQYYVGEKVKIAGVEGQVKEISLRKTVIEDKNGLLHLIPNSQIKIVAKKNEQSRQFFSFLFLVFFRRPFRIHLPFSQL